MKVFFATDIHGSEICWRKFLNSAAFYKADMVILGGDVTGHGVSASPSGCLSLKGQDRQRNEEANRRHFTRKRPRGGAQGTGG